MRPTFKGRGARAGQRNLGRAGEGEGEAREEGER